MNALEATWEPITYTDLTWTIATLVSFSVADSFLVSRTVAEPFVLICCVWLFRLFGLICADVVPGASRFDQTHCRVPSTASRLPNPSNQAVLVQAFF